MLVVVPDSLRDALYAAIEKALHGRPCTDQDRETLYGQLLAYYDEHGRIPEFELKQADAEGEKP